jgi:hypothetical protein
LADPPEIDISKKISEDANKKKYLSAFSAIALKLK